MSTEAGSTGAGSAGAGLGLGHAPAPYVRFLPLSVRLAMRELRGGLTGFRIFLACLALGVAAIAGVGSVASSVVAGLKADAKILLGGDVELRLVHRPAGPAQRQFLADAGALSEVIDMRAMARRLDGDRRTLVELKAVDGAYPLYGAMQVEPEQNLRDVLAERDGAWGAVVDPIVMERLGLAVGDRMKIGDAVLVVRAAVAREPDSSGNAFVFGPRVMVASGAMPGTGLIQESALIGYNYRLKLPPGSDARAWVERLKAQFPEAGWRIRDFGDAAPSVQRFLDRITMFLTLVGLTALLVGGVGVGNAVRGYLAGRTATIATLKCLGAPSRLVFEVYLIQIMVLAALGIAIGLVVGALAPVAVAHFLADKLPVAARIALYPLPLALATTFGVLVTLVFSLWPIGRAGEIPAASLFRDLVAPNAGRPRWWVILATIVTALALAALAIVSAEDRKIAAWFVAGSAGTLLIFRVAALAIMALARRAGRPRSPTLRLALTNLYRPGAPTPSVIVSLGLGLTVLVAIALIQSNLVRQVVERLPGAAPSYYFIDIQPEQVAEFDRLMTTTPGVLRSEHVPSLRGRITRLNGVPVEQASVAPEAQWALRSERGLTYAARQPNGSRVVAGQWWPEDYAGKPLISFDSELARGMGLALGDTITINVLGREVTATIANLRSIDWSTLGINFTLVFAPGTLESAPQSFIAAVYSKPEAEERVQRAVTDRFANVSAIRVKDALETVARLFDSIAAAVRVTAAITLVAGTLVLAGAIAAGHKRRVWDAVVLKVLGATRHDVARAFLLEYGLLGLVTAAIGGALGTIAAWLVITQVMRADWVFAPQAVLVTAALSTALTLVVGFAGTWRALGAKAAPLLRNP